MALQATACCTAKIAHLLAVLELGLQPFESGSATCAAKRPKAPSRPILAVSMAVFQPSSMYGAVRN